VLTRRLVTAAVAFTLTLTVGVVLSPAPAFADPPIKVDIGRSQDSGIDIEVTSPGSEGPGSGGSGGPVSPVDCVDAGNPACRPCDISAESATCDTWQWNGFCGQNAGSTSPPTMTTAQFLAGMRCRPAAAPPSRPSALLLAQRAYGLMVLPKPTLGRSPDPTLEWRGYAFTYVNLWTWFWTDPATFAPRSQTVTAGGISATVTARPTGLVFDPGNGDEPVSCIGPGRPWEDSDRNDEPDTGCGYKYPHVTADGPVTATVGIEWDVTWVGSNGQSGALAPLVTEVSQQLNVLQIQTVNR